MWLGPAFLVVSIVFIILTSIPLCCGGCKENAQTIAIVALVVGGIQCVLTIVLGIIFDRRHFPSSCFPLDAIIYMSLAGCILCECCQMKDESSNAYARESVEAADSAPTVTVDYVAWPVAV